MAETVDSLSIEFTASTESAEQSIDKLIGMLNRLKGAVSRASNFSRVAKGIAEIAEAAKGLDTEAGRKLARLAGGLDALSKVGSLDNLKGAGKNLASVIKAVSGETGGKGLSGLADGIKQTNDALGGIKDSDVSKLGAIRDTLAGEVSGPLHTSERVSESAALGGMGAPEPSFGNMAAYSAMTVFRYTADSIREATAAYREFGAALAEGGSSVETQFSDSAMTVFKYTADSIRDATAAYREFRAALGGGMPPIFTDFTNSAAQAGESVRMLTGSVGGGQEGPWEADEIRDAARAYDDLGSSASRAADVIETEFADTEKAAGGLTGLRDTLGSIGSYIANDVSNVFSNTLKAIGNFGRSVLRIARYRMIRSMIRTITEGFSEGKKNLYEWSQAMDGHFAASMDRLATSTQYLKNSLGTLVGPLMEALEPALNHIIDVLVTIINYFNMFVAAISGRSTYTAAVRAATSWGGAVSNAAGNASNAVSNAVDDMKRTIMGFDEINKLNDVADSGGGSGGGGSGGGGSGGGVSAMFEERPLSGGFQDFGNAIETALQDSLSRITMIVGAAELAVGAILALSGANVPLGLALIATGAVTMGSAIFANWDGIPDEIKLVVGAIEAALGGGLAVGAVLAFSTVHIGLGIGLMVAALSTEFSAVTVVWTTLKDKIGGQIQAIGVLLGSATFGMGAVLAFAGHPTIGIPMMIAGASVAAVAVNWNYLTEALKGPIGDVVALISGALLMLGVAAIAASNVPLGVGLLVAGATGLAATLAVNWNNLGSLMEGPIGKATLAISGALLVLGFAAVSAAQVPLGIGLMVAGAAGLATSLATNWDRLKEYMQGPIGTLVGLISGALLVLGFTAIAASHIPLGVGLMVAGAAGLATSITPVWTTLQDKLKGPIGAVTALISGASLALGVLAIIAGNIPLGLGLILAGTAGLVSTVAANWDGLVTIGKTAIAKVQEGWETVKELVVNAVVSLVKKVGEWAEDVWDFLQNTGATIAKKVTAAFEAAKSFAGDVWDSVKTGAETIVKTVNAIFSEVGTWAGNVWNAVKAGAETIVKTVNAIFSEVGTWSGKVWDAVKNGAETIVKTVSAIFSEVGTWSGNVWNAVKTGAEDIVKTVKAIFTEVGTWAGNVWNAVKAGAETIVKTVNAIFSEVGTWAGNVWDTVKAGTETIEKTVNAVAGEAKEFAGDVWDFITSPDAVSKTVNAVFAFAQNAISDLWDSMSEAWTNFVKGKWLYVNAKATIEPEFGLDPTDPAYEDNVAKLKKLVQMALNAGEWNFPVDMTANFPEGSIEAAQAEFQRRWNEKNPTAQIVPTKSDNWEQEWDELVGGEIPIPVTPTNSLGNKITSPLQWLFGSNTAPEINTKVNGTAGTGFSGVSGNKFSLSGVNDTSAKVNASAGTGFSGISENKFSLGGINAGSVTVNGTPGTGFAEKLSGTNKYTLAGIESATVDVKSNLTGAATGSKTNVQVHGSSFDTYSKLAGKTDTGAKTLTEIYGDFNTQSILTGANKKAEGAKTLTGIYGDFNTQSILTGANKKAEGAKTLTGIYGDFNTKSILTGANKNAEGAKTLTGIYGDFNTKSILTGANKKAEGAKTLTGIYGDFNTKSILTGANKNAEGAKTLTGIYGDFNTKSILTGANKKAEGAKTLTGIYGDFNTKSKLIGKTSDSKKLSQVHGNVFDSKSKLTGKASDSKTLTSVFGNSFSVSASLSSSSAQALKSAATKAMKGIEVTVKAKSDSGGVKMETQKTGGVIAGGRFHRFAQGGVIRNGIASLLSSIPHYAGGTIDAHGTLFLAGEAGPEILGHVGGRTEVLNQSQLAQTMFDAVRSAMAGVRIGGYIENAVSSEGSEADYETMYRAMYDAFTDAMAGSNERDREKVALMRQIAAKEFTAEVTAASVNRAQTRMNRRAGTTIVPVGT